MRHLSLVRAAVVRAPAPDPFETDLTDHTPDHADCPACMATNRALVADNLELASMQFPAAASSWMMLRRQSPGLRPRTHETTQGYLDALAAFFGELRLCDITPGHIRSYQIARLHNAMHVAGVEVQPWQRKAGHSIINHEVCALGMMLTHCCLWHRIKPYYFPLKMKGWSPRTILTEEEEEQLWKTAAKHPEAALAYWVAVITNNTTAAGIELRGLRLKHLFLSADEISEFYIPEDAVKNNSRPRKIALNAPAKWAAEQLYKRALKLGCCEPDHYLLPFRVKRNTYDPRRPASRWFLRKSWDKLRAATGFRSLNPHDLRHHCITRLLENDVNENTVIAIAGHVSKKMMEYYAHQRRRVKYEAVRAIEPQKKKPVKREEAPKTAARSQRPAGSPSS
jgi:integrase